MTVSRRLGSLITTAAILLAGGCGTGQQDTASNRVGYHKIDGKWSYVWDGGGERLFRNLSADETTFEVLRSPEYAKDKSRVFYEGRDVDGAEPLTFHLLSDPSYAADSVHVYVIGRVIPGGDPPTFRLLKGSYSRDASAIYCGTVKMDVRNPNGFEVVFPGTGWEEYYVKDDFLFNFGEEFTNVRASQDSPAVCGETWARDGTEYYYGPARVHAADYASFRVIELLHGEGQERRL